MRLLRVLPAVFPAYDTAVPAAVLRAVGGRANVVEATCHHGRVRLRLADPSVVDEAAVGIRALARPAPDIIHLLTGECA